MYVQMHLTLLICLLEEILFCGKQCPFLFPLRAEQLLKATPSKASQITAVTINRARILRYMYIYMYIDLSKLAEPCISGKVVSCQGIYN